MQSEKRPKVDVVCGPMFGGKTEELLRRVKLAVLADLGVQVFYPDTDTRVREGRIVSHAGNSIGDAGPTPMRASPNERFDVRVRANTRFVAIDEGQFFGPVLVDVVRALVEQRGLQVVVSGLDLDFMGRPFGVMPALMALADSVVKVKAVCYACKSPEATRTVRLSGGSELIQVGAEESYQPACVACWASPQGEPG